MGATTQLGGRGKLMPPPFTPYEYQVPIIKKMIGAILDRKSGLIPQPTGTGKSVEAAFTARAAILLHKKRGLYLYSENEGLDQARKRFEEIFAGNKISCANFFGYSKEHHVDTADLVFASFQSMNNHHEKWYKMFDKEHFDFIIVNEAHHGQAVTYKEVIDYFECPKIGMTATPKRMDGKDIQDIFPEIFHEILLEEAIVKGWVAGIEYHALSHGISTQKLKKICKDVLEDGKRISIKQLNETIFIELLDEEILNEIYKYAFPVGERPRQTLIYCENVAHAERIYGKLKKDGKSAARIHTGKECTQKGNRDSLKAFRLSKIQFLVSVNKLNEDIDVPNAELGVLLRSTDSWTIFIQQVGRLLRRTKMKDKAILLDFVANVERMFFVQELIGRISKILEENKIPLERTPLHVTGDGFDFSFSDEMVDMLKVLQAIRDGLYPTWEDASKATTALGIKTTPEYYKKYREDLRLPARPDKTYPGTFPGWAVFLGRDYMFRPKGWMVRSALADKLGISEKSVIKYTDPYRISNPEWFGFYESGGGVCEFFSPELILISEEKSLEQKKERKVAPSGWETIEALAKRKVAAVSTLEKMTEPYRDRNSKWFKTFWKKNAFVEHLSPVLVRKIMKRLAKERPRPPRGWIGVVQLAKEYSTSSNTVKSNAKKYLADHKEWSKTFWLGVTYGECYSPELVAILRPILQSREFGSKPIK